jgi:hypothetical protein
VANYQAKSFNQPPAERYYTEYVEVSTEEGATNDSLRKALGEKQRWGWQLVTFTVDRSGSIATLVWDTSGFRNRD